MEHKTPLCLIRLVEGKLPELLAQPEIWKGKDILYHAPRVERIWTDGKNIPGFSDLRLSLHIIHPTDEPCLFHPHPWPSVIKVVHGGYEMGVGYGEGITPPEEACRLRLSAGSCYEMSNKNGWHYVKPLETCSLSIMLSGDPWDREMPIEPPHGSNPDMTRDQIDQVIRMFQLYYPPKQV